MAFPITTFLGEIENIRLPGERKPNDEYKRKKNKFWQRNEIEKLNPIPIV
jgi:hypothetical protein